METPIELAAHLIKEADDLAQSYLHENNRFANPLTLEDFIMQKTKEIEPYVNASWDPEQEGDIMNDFIKHVRDPDSRQKEIKRQALREYNQYMKQQKYFFGNRMEILNKNYDIFFALDRQVRVYASQLMSALFSVIALPERCPTK